jgi:hypothetical protein
VLAGQRTGLCERGDLSVTLREPLPHSPRVNLARRLPDFDLVELGQDLLLAFDREFGQFGMVEDIRKPDGVREAIWLYEGKILDGRNRYRAAAVAGVPCPTRIYDGVVAVPGDACEGRVG